MMRVGSLEQRASLALHQAIDTGTSRPGLNIKTYRCQIKPAFVLARRKDTAHCPSGAGAVTWVHGNPWFAVKAACGQHLLRPRAVEDIESVRDLCERCLLADFGHVVYTFHGDDGPLYVGQTCNLPARVCSHRAQEWWPAVRRITFERASSGREALDLELATIRRLQPRHNVKGMD